MWHRCRATPPKNFGVAPPHPPVPGGVAPKFGSEEVSRYTGVSQLQLRVSRYTVQSQEKCTDELLQGGQGQDSVRGSKISIAQGHVSVLNNAAKGEASHPVRGALSCQLLAELQNISRYDQEPLNAPFLHGLFSSGFSRGKTVP